MFRAICARPLLGWAAVLIIVLCGTMSRAMAVELTDQGLSFSDERGSFRLVSVTGTGTPEDPITVTEEVIGPGQPILIIRGFGMEFGNPAHTFHSTGFAMKKIAINHTGKAWGSYRVELREVETRHSNYGDGLSFGQGDAGASTYASSTTFPESNITYEPEDSVTFSGAEVPPGGTAVMQFVITDMSPVHQFFLFQQPTEPLAQRDMPTPDTQLARLWASRRH